MPTIPMPMRARPSLWLHWIAFIAGYVVLDWASYLHPLHGLNITPWNPAPALGFVYWLRYGRVTAVPWFAAILIGEAAVRGLPAPLPLTIVFSAWLTIGYGAIAEVLCRRFVDRAIFHNRQYLFVWLAVVVVGTLTNSLGYISLLHLAGFIPRSDFTEALARFWIGDCVGVIVAMPIIWMLADERGRARLSAIVQRWETGAYSLLAAAMLWVAFGLGGTAEFQYFYFLFLPVVWAAARQGLAGASLIACALQLGIIAAVLWLKLIAVTVSELQMLAAVLALVGFFIGVVVDEQRQAAEDLKHSLRLAAAGEMAAALAHELNQPMTALAAYGKTCEVLLGRGETGEPLAEAIRRMVAESARAAETVRRLRDFFRTGATKLETVALGTLFSAAAAAFGKRALDNQVTLVISPPPAVTVLADPLQLEVVLRNLLANAVESVLGGPAGGRRVSLSGAVEAGGRVCVSVEDSGQGISPSVAARLFEPFASKKSSGLGLGLVISKAIIEAHGGSLWAEVGERGVFKFVLPLQEKHDDAAP